MKKLLLHTLLSAAESEVSDTNYKFLTFISEQENATLNFTFTDGSIQFRMGSSGTWKTYDSGTEIKLNTQKKVQFKNKSNNLTGRSLFYNRKYWCFWRYSIIIK
jgi:uncharacterized protein YaiE (UPF0345 family)